MQTSLLRDAIHIAAIFACYLAIAMLAPAAVELYYGNRDWQAFALSAFFTGGLAMAVALATHNPKRQVVSARFGFLIVNLLWLTTCMVGMVPFLAVSTEMTLVNALFESMAGVTTTGATILNGLAELPPGILLWRSILQWMGGIGVIALGLFLLPFLKVGGYLYFRIESTDIEDRPFARLSTFALGIAGIYGALTFACILAYSAAGMTAFDAINHGLTTVSTAGFSTHDESLGFYAAMPAVLWVGTVFMFIGALPFSALILFALRGRFEAMADPQIRVFAACAALIVLIAAFHMRLELGMEMPEALSLAAFNFMSVVTTTGYSAGAYDSWGPFLFALAFLAMFIGGCSGSTSGGVKTYRFIILHSMIVSGLRKLIYPSSVDTVRYDGRPVATELERAVILFVGVFLFLWALITLLLAWTGLDFISALTASLSALMNVGPGLGDTVGPAGDYSSVSSFGKLLLAFAMLAGRLEMLTVLVLFAPDFWRR